MALEVAAHGTRRGGTLWVLVGVLGAVWLVIAAVRAANEPLWLDEVFALQAYLRGGDVVSLVVDGARGESSPAPLDYLLLKGLHAARNTVRYLGLPPHVYYRLVALLSTLLAALVAFGFALSGKAQAGAASNRVAVRVLCIFAFVSFLLSPWVFPYADEMRPYGLWTALWLVAALSLVGKTKRARIVSILVLVLLAMTATAAVFQIAALAAAVFCVAVVERRSLAHAAAESATLFALPLGVSLFYCLKVGQLNCAAGETGWSRFPSFWASHWWIGAAGLAAAALCLMRPQTHRFAVPPLGLAVFYLLGPVIFEATKLKGFFFTERQYVGYGATIPILCATCALVVGAAPVVRTETLRAGLAVPLAILILLGTAHAAWRTIGMLAREQATWRTARGIPGDSRRLLSGLLQRELPRAFCVPNDATPTALENVRLVAEWLPVRYRSLPVGERVVLLDTRGDGAEVKALAQSCGSARAVPVVRAAPK
jgi:hypothetical protein